MATGRDPGRFRVALHLLLDRFDRQRLLGAFAVPKDIPLRSGSWMLCQTLLDTAHRIRRQIDAAIFPPFALHDMDRLLLPINLLQRELSHLRNTQSTAEDHQKQGPVHGMGDLGKAALDLLPREGFGQGTPAPHKVTRLDWVAHHQLLVQAIIKKKCFSALSRRLIVAHARPC
jgi:hypothetical protein